MLLPLTKLASYPIPDSLYSFLTVGPLCQVELYTSGKYYSAHTRNIVVCTCSSVGAQGEGKIAGTLFGI